MPSAAVQQETVALYRDVVAEVAAARDGPDDPTRARIAELARRTFDHAVAGLYGLSFVERDLTSI